MDDDDIPSPDELEQLARSLLTDGSLGRRDAQRVAEVLRAVAAKRRHPSGPPISRPRLVIAISGRTTWAGIGL